MLHYKMLVGSGIFDFFGCGYMLFSDGCSCHFSQVVVVYGTGYGENVRKVFKEDLKLNELSLFFI